MKHRKSTAWQIAGCLALLLCSQAIGAQQLAFPGAEGAGKFVSGGRGSKVAPTTVFEVTSLADNNGVGTLRYACQANAASRTIVFRLSGTIHLTSPLKIPSNTTIAGQTAPGDGITLADYWTTLNGENIIVRYLRFRMGDKNQLFVMDNPPAGCNPVNKADITKTCYPKPNVSGSYDSFGGSYKKNIIIDHCSVSWSDDEALSLKESDSTTIQWTMVSEPLNYSYHFETLDGTAKTLPEADFQEHGYGGIFGGFHATFHHNIYAHCKSRTPRFGASGADLTRVDFRNNLIYNWGINNVYGGEGGEFNVVNNYYKSGANTTRRCQYVDMETTAKYFVAGNKMDDPTCGAIAQKNSGLTAPILADLTPETQSADSAYISVLAKAGASLKRDAVDERIINEIKTRTGKYVDVQGGYTHGTSYAISKNAWPILNSTPAPLDSDHDGIPDAWESSHGLNPNDAADAKLITASGYSNLELYINSLLNAPSSSSSSVSAVSSSNTISSSSSIALPPSSSVIKVSSSSIVVVSSSSSSSILASSSSVIKPISSSVVFVSSSTAGSSSSSVIGPVSNLHVSPNPIFQQGDLFFNWDPKYMTKPITFVVMDIRGTVVRKFDAQNITRGINQVWIKDCHQLPNGNYLVKAQLGAAVIATTTFTKR